MVNLKVSLRFIKIKLWQSIGITLIIALGTLVFYFILNSTTHLENLVLDNFIKNESHISYNGEFYLDEESLELLRNKTKSISTEINDVAFYNSVVGSVLWTNRQTARNVIIKGIDYETMGSIHGLDSILENGNIDSIPQDLNSSTYIGEIILSDTILSNIVYNYNPTNIIGRTITVTINDKPYRFKVVGTFSTNDQNVNRTYIFTTINTVNKIYERDVYNGIDINLNIPLNSHNIIKKTNQQILSELPSLTPSDWQQKHRLLTNLFNLEKTSILIIQIITAASIAFSLATIFLLNIKKKHQQIGILKALGLNNFNTTLIFIYQLIIFSIVGIAFGIIGGNILLVVVKNQLIKQVGYNILNLNTSFINIYSIITTIVIFASLFLTNLFSFIKLNRLKPVSIIKDL